MWPKDSKKALLRASLADLSPKRHRWSWGQDIRLADSDGDGGSGPGGALSLGEGVDVGLPAGDVGELGSVAEGLGDGDVSSGGVVAVSQRRDQIIGLCMWIDSTRTVNPNGGHKRRRTDDCLAQQRRTGWRGRRREP